MEVMVKDFVKKVYLNVYEEDEILEVEIEEGEEVSITLKDERNFTGVVTKLSKKEIFIHNEDTDLNLSFFFGQISNVELV